MNCSQCGRELKLYEQDEQTGWKIMRCETCGLFYHLKRGWGKDNWKLVKTSQLIYMTPKAART